MKRVMPEIKGGESVHRIRDQAFLQAELKSLSK